MWQTAANIAFGILFIVAVLLLIKECCGILNHLMTP
jgi:hypothetical protein